MKIALMPALFDNQFDESSQVTLILLAKELKRLGHDVCVISEGSPKYELFDSIPIYRGFTALKQLKNMDILHSFSASRAFVLKSILARLLYRDVKIVHTLRSYSRFRFESLFTKLLNFVEIVTVSTKTFANSLKNYKVKVIRSPINLDKFKPSKVKKNYILYYGNLTESKGVDVLLEAMKHLKDAKLKMIIRQSEKVQEKYTKNKNVTIVHKSVRNIEDYVNSASLVVLPYINITGIEGNPSCLLEAMACKTPVITTDLPELREIISTKDAVMVEPGNSKRLGIAIKKLLKDKRLQRKLTEHAYKTVQKFDIKRIAKQFTKVYEKLLLE